MHLQGSCHCGAVRFSVEAYAPVPYLRCYCSICRKTAGGGGYAINLGAKADTLKVDGEDAIAVFHARIDGEESPAERRFCARCGSALWLWDPRWPELVHPFASAIDTPLPTPPEQEHIMLGSKANWVRSTRSEASRVTTNIHAIRSRNGTGRTGFWTRADGVRRSCTRQAAAFRRSSGRIANTEGSAGAV